MLLPGGVVLVAWPAESEEAPSFTSENINGVNELRIGNLKGFHDTTIIHLELIHFSEDRKCVHSHAS